MSREKPLATPPKASGDFDAVYQAEAGHVWSYLRRLGIPERHREDVLHDTFLVAYRQLKDYDPSRPIRPWLFGIAFRVASDHRRRAHSRREILTDNIEANAGEYGIDSALAIKQLQLMVRAELDRLSFDQRTVFVLHEIEGYSIPEIAEILGENLTALYSRLWRARKQFIEGVRRLREAENQGGE